MVSTPGKWGTSPALWGICLAVLLAGLAVALLADRGADPPLVASEFEGQLLLGARAALPGEDIPLGEWRPDLLAPIQILLDTWAFRMFGRGLETARALTALLALAAVAGFYAVLRRSMGAMTAFLAALFLAVNPVFFAVARTALPSVLSLLLMLLAIRVWMAGAHRALAAFASGALIVIAGLVENGPTNVFFLFMGALMVVFVRAHAWKMAWRSQTSRRLRFVTAGAVVTLAVYFVFVIAHWQEYGSMWGHLGKLSFRALLSNIVRAPVYVVSMLKHMPITVIVALGYFLFFAKGAMRPLARHRRLDELRLWLLAWLLVGVPVFVLRGSTSLSNLILLAPPISALAAEGIVRLFALRSFERPRIDVMIVMLLIAGCTWFVVAWLVNVLMRRLELSGFWAEHELRSAFLMMILVWSTVTYLLGWLYLRWKRFAIPLRPVPVMILTVVLTTGIIGRGTAETALWWRHRTHDVEAAGALLEALPARALVVGSWAPAATASRRARAAIIWPGINEDDAPWHTGISHLLLQEGRETDPSLPPLRLFTQEPGRDVSVKPLASTAIGGKRVTLFEVVRGGPAGASGL